MNELDWEYIIDILDKATAGATGCSPTLFVASNALQKLQDEFDQPLDEVERQKCIGALENFHTHSGILHDLGFLEVWDPRDFFAKWGGGGFIDGSVYWPKRVTASGYIFLENLSESQNDDGKLLRLLKTVGVRAAQELGKASLDQAISRFPSFFG